MKMFSLVFLTLLVAAGCTSIPKPQPGDPRYAPVMPVEQPSQSRSMGSIYASGTGVSLWEDKRARRVGDIITVYLDEKTISSKKNKTDIKKEDEQDMDVAELLGRQPSFKLPGISDNSFNLNTDISSKRKFKGDTGSDQSNRLVGQISVTVSDVLSNGVLIVRGEKWMTFSQGDEFIRIEGMLRPADISPDNSVISSRLADARLTYSATGALADAQQQGWMSRVFNSPWWPF